MYRIIGPYDAVTQDFELDRLNLYTDAAGVVQRITCPPIVSGGTI